MSRPPGLLRLRQLLAPERKALALAAISMAALAATTALSAALVGPAVQALLGVEGSVAPGGAGPWFGSLPGAVAVSHWLPAAILVVAATKGLAYFGQFHLMARVGQRTASRLRRELSSDLLQASPDWLGTQQTGELLTRFTGDVAAVELAITYAVAGYLRDGVTAALLLGICLWTDWRLTLLAAGALPLTLWPLARLLRRSRRYLRGAAESRGALGHLVAEGLQGLPSLQVDGLEQREAARFSAELRRALGHQLGAARVRALTSPLMELAAAAGICALLAIAAGRVADGGISGERLASFLAAALLLAQPLKALGKVVHFASAGRVALGRLDQSFASLRADRAGAELGTRLPAAPLRETLALVGVTFRYGAEGPPALDRLSLTVARGERVALVGASGAGKSTVFALLLGLRRAEAGQVRYDGLPLEAFDRASLRRQLAWLEQEPFLFDGTVAENIALGDPAPDPTRLRTAAERAQALAFIERAGGFSAPVGERGRRFSGGERQRLGIARALYQDAGLLLLDEPTSQLDPEGEAALQRSLGELLRGRTSLVIAHRLSTVRGCDRAVVLARGQVVEDGRPEILLAGSGPFSRLFGSAARPDPELG